MPDQQIEQQLVDESKFLHDLATPLMVAIHRLDTIVTSLGDLNASAETLTSLKKAQEALDKIRVLHTGRRAVVHAQRESLK